MSWYYDIPNLLVCIAAVIIVCRINLIPYWIGIILGSYSLIPFFLNDFLFPAVFMSDQFFYTETLKEVRSFNFFPDKDKNALVTSWLLSILPLPYVETVKSIGFYNRFLFLILFVWLYNKKFLRGMPLFFIIFYPSLIFYTSLSLRDPLILFLMIVGVIFLIDKKYIKFLFIILPLLFIKWQNFFFMLILAAFFLILKKPKLNYLIRFPIYGSIILSLIIYFDDLLYYLNLFRGALFQENGGLWNEYIPLSNFYDLALNGIIAFPHFLMKPLFWEARNLFQFVQSFENVFVLIFLIYFTWKSYLEDKFITVRWLTYFIFVMTIYGLAVYNFGTAVRYKYPFLVMYIVGISYELYKVRGYLFSSEFKKKVILKKN